MRFHKSVFENIEKEINQEIEKNHYPGISYGIVHNGQLIHANSLGFADVAKGIPLDWQRHRFAAGSISKIFTTLAVYNALEATNGYDLETKVVDILPWLHRDRSDLGDITIKHLLSHQSGLQRSVGGTSISDIALFAKGEYSPAYEHMENIFAKVERRYPESGTVPQYSNLAYALLGRVILELAEKNNYPFADGDQEQKIAQYIREQVIAPLGLADRVDFLLPGPHREWEVTQYSGGFSPPDQYSDEPFRYTLPPILTVGMALTHSGILSTVTGLAGLAIEIDKMMQGLFAHNVISNQSFDQLTTMVTRNIDKVEGEAMLGNGIGALLFERLKVDDNKEILTVGHTGTAVGSRSYMNIEPTTGVGVVLMLNEGLADRHLFAKIIFRNILQNTAVQKDRLSKMFTDKLASAEIELKTAKKLTDKQLDVLPKVGNKVTVAGLKKALKEVEGLEPYQADRAIQSMVFRHFEGSGIGGQLDRRLVFRNQAGDLVANPSDEDSIELATGTSDDSQPLFLDLHQTTGRLVLRMDYSPVFVAFAYMFIKLELSNDGEVDALIMDNTFRYRAALPGERLFPGIPIVTKSQFPGGAN